MGGIGGCFCTLLYNKAIKILRWSYPNCQIALVPGYTQPALHNSIVHRASLHLCYVVTHRVVLSVESHYSVHKTVLHLELRLLIELLYFTKL